MGEEVTGDARYPDLTRRRPSPGWPTPSSPTAMAPRRTAPIRRTGPRAVRRGWPPAARSTTPPHRMPAGSSSATTTGSPVRRDVQGVLRCRPAARHRRSLRLVLQQRRL